MIPQNQPKKETTFNSSIATLMRIDKLIGQNHSLRRGIIPLNDFGQPVKTGHPDRLYKGTLGCLNVEIITEMTPTEETNTEEHKKKIATFESKNHNDLNNPTIFKNFREFKNPKYYLAWEELHILLDDYFIFLMKTASNHGMLLITKSTGVDGAIQE